MILATTHIYPLSLHDALPILEEARGAGQTEEGNRKSHRRSRGELTHIRQYRSSFGFFFLCIVSHLPSSERSEEHTSELQSHSDLVCRLLLEKKKKKKI